MSEREITIKEFADLLTKRINDEKVIDCCQIEIKRLAAIAKAKIPEEKIMVEWID